MCAEFLQLLVGFICSKSVIARSEMRTNSVSPVDRARGLDKWQQPGDIGKVLHPY